VGQPAQVAVLSGTALH